MNWLPTDIALAVALPVLSDDSTRSPRRLEAIVSLLEPEHSARYRKRDITGDGIDETFCNCFCVDATALLGAPLPRGKRANELADWLPGADGIAAGWMHADAHAAQEAADKGRPAVAVWKNPKSGPGHIALLVPSSSASVCIAQAGVENYSRAPLQWGFGSLPVQFFTHA